MSAPGMRLDVPPKTMCVIRLLSQKVSTCRCTRDSPKPMLRPSCHPNDVERSGIRNLGSRRPLDVPRGPPVEIGTRNWNW